MTVSFRRLHSFRDFHGSQKVPVPAPPELFANTHVHTLNFAGTYAVNQRFNFTIELPINFGSRQTYYEHDVVTLHTMRARGIGDLKFSGNVWLLDPKCHKNGNISAGAGVKFPTGKHGATDISFRGSTQVRRPVDPAIQPGDGGWGLILTAHAFRKVNKRAFLYAQGTYLSNPREMNGTQPPAGDDPLFNLGDIGYMIDSVPDQYLIRGGVSYTVLQKEQTSLAVTFGPRAEGVPTHDLIGGSQGYRLPGYAISVEPGFTISRKKDLIEFSMPFAIHRHANKSIADVRTNNPLGGFAALADHTITISYSRRF
ncbi:MAG: hypothetical protein ACT4OT_14870 [Acidobacteriota bacterium]